MSRPRGTGGTRGPLRVAYIDHCARLSGGELALLRMLEEMTGIERHVVLAEDGPLVSLLRSSGAAVEVLPLAERSRNLHRSKITGRRLAGPVAAETIIYAVRLAARLRRLRPDIVHTNSLKSALYGGVAAKLARIPLVVQLNDRIAEDYLPAPAVRLVHAALRWMPDAIVANSHVTARTLVSPPRRRAGPRPVVIYPPVPPVVAPAAERGETLRIGMVGRLSRTKGQTVFLHALAAALGDNDNWEAVVVGAPMFGAEDERYAAHLHVLTRQLGLEHRVKFLGFRDDVPAELARMHMLVHASIDPEPFGLVVVEAMAAGLPVIAAEPGGPAEVIEDKVTGLLYPARDVAALAAAIRRLAADPPLRDRLGAAAKLKAAEFAPANTVAKMMGVYETVAPGADRPA